MAERYARKGGANSAMRRTLLSEALFPVLQELQEKYKADDVEVLIVLHELEAWYDPSAICSTTETTPEIAGVKGGVA